jgi:hypothetical protein
MAKDEWGDHLTLQATADIFKVNIRYFSNINGQWNDISPTSEEACQKANSRDKLLLCHYHEFHYGSVFYLEELEEELDLDGEGIYKLND